MAVKVAEVRINLNGVVQIKVNRGANIVLKGEYALGFKSRIQYHKDRGLSESDARLSAAKECLEIFK